MQVGEVGLDGTQMADGIKTPARPVEEELRVSAGLIPVAVLIKQADTLADDAGEQISFGPDFHHVGEVDQITKQGLMPRVRTASAQGDHKNHASDLIFAHRNEMSGRVILGEQEIHPFPRLPFSQVDFPVDPLQGKQPPQMPEPT